MKLIEVDKPYSWLSWPVTLKNCKEPSLHLTLKFFGHAKIEPAVVEEVLANQPRIEGIDVQWLRQRLTWVPEIFSGPVHVLEFNNAYTSLIRRIHSEFALIKDQFIPWRPHITVPYDYWNCVREERLTPSSEELTFGPIELYWGVGEDK